jgi:hypothetical protein
MANKSESSFSNGDEMLWNDSDDDEDFSVSWPASDEWRVIGVWSALSYRRWLMLGLCLCTLVLAPSIVISYSNIIGCFWLDMWSDKRHQHQ